MQEVTFEGLNNEWNFTVQERWLATLGAVGGREHKPRGAADRKEQEQRHRRLEIEVMKFRKHCSRLPGITHFGPFSSGFLTPLVAL